MRKKIVISFISVIFILMLFYVLFSPGIIKPETISSGIISTQNIVNIEDLEDDCYYVWHSAGTDIKDDLKDGAKQNVFIKCPKGTVNWQDNKNVSHTIWFTSLSDDEIPTLYPNDKLIYVSKTTLPSSGIKWERYADYGYTIGVTNLQEDTSGHYRIFFNIEKGYAGYINFDSDAVALSDYTKVAELYLDKVEGISVRKDLISEGGTVIGLEKDKKYLCEWYTGTYYQDYEMSADNHTFCMIEEFTTYEYEFLHSRAISITIPEWFKTGYYYIGGIGLFRYVSMADLNIYNGLAYDENVDWNDPIKLYDDRGLIIYDPSVNLDKRMDNIRSGANADIFSDIGAEAYENFE